MATIKSFQARALASAAGFLRNRKGGVAITFGLSFPVIAFLSLVVVDYSRASAAKQAMQETLDAAALLVARSTATEADNLDAIGDRAFAAQLPAESGLNGFDLVNGRLTNVTFSLDGNKIVSTANGTVTPIVASVFLDGPMAVKATSEVQRTMNKLEIALVLDTTGSMETNDKIGKLKTAATEFIDAMALAAARSAEVDPVKIAIVPFSTTVKVSAPVSMYVSKTDNYDETNHKYDSKLPTWLDGRSRAWADNDISSYKDKLLFDTDTPDRFYLLEQMGVSWGGCVEARRAPYDIQDTAPTTAANPTKEQLKTLFTPFFWPDDPDPKPKKGTGNGSFGTFKNNYLTDGKFSTTDWKVPQRDTTKYAIGRDQSKIKQGTFSQGYGYGADLTYGPNAGCAMQQMHRLSTNFDELKDVVDGLVASGETNIPLGLMWGWHAISPNKPFADGSAYGTAKVQKIIVLMTDGDNTMNTTSNDNDSWYHGYGYIWQDHLGTTSSNSGTRTSKMDDRMSALCANLKNPLLAANPDPDKAIIVYTVGVGVSNNAKTKLQACASTTDKYYDVDSQASNLSATFSAIAGSIENLRITH